MGSKEMTGASADWQETTYRETYEKELRGLRRRLASDLSCTTGDLEGTLKNLYIMDGADWLGRGELQSAVLAATIAAYETVIGELHLGIKRKP
ncbi:hypothetical protein AGMMS50230_13390 [Spirochaetia bacterium]|nr:hypothetical protein AGMMS50230_13390 [Spirochaetia bacterium]